MENKVQDIIIEALNDAGYNIETDNGVSDKLSLAINRLWITDIIATTGVSIV